MTAYDDHYARKLLTITGVMIAAAFVAGVCMQAIVLPWLRGDDVRPKPIDECKVRVDRIEAELADVRRDCFGHPEQP